jgi:hypothetical protein
MDGYCPVTWPSADHRAFSLHRFVQLYCGTTAFLVFEDEHSREYESILKSFLIKHHVPFCADPVSGMPYDKGRDYEVVRYGIAQVCSDNNKVDSITLCGSSIDGAVDCALDHLRKIVEHESGMAGIIRFSDRNYSGYFFL